MRTAVITITSGRDAHLHRQRMGLAALPPCQQSHVHVTGWQQRGSADVGGGVGDGAGREAVGEVGHVVVGMGGAARLGSVPGAPPVVPVTVPVPSTGLPLAAARNAGAAAALAAGAELLVFLDVDCIPGPALLQRYAAAAGPERALLCGPVHYLPPPPPGGYPTTGLDALAPPHPARPAPPAGTVLAEDRFELFWSLSFAVSASAWRTLGGFCEDYTGYGGEDTDFAFTAAAAGATLHWVGGATAFHQHHPPSRTAHAAEIVANAALFHRRHGWWPMRGWLAEIAAEGSS